jgi:hypothetical protein
MMTELGENKLNTATLSTARNPFSVVPADAPELLAVLEEFDHLLQRDSVELQNAWGAIVITDNQQGLRRVDLVISWDEIQLEGGDPVLDENGNVIFVLDENGNRVRRTDSDHIFLHEDSGYFK